MPASVSVVLCCYNSASRLPATLAHLAKQKVSPDVAWEVLVIDNGSTDNTDAVAKTCWPVQGPAPLRVLRETTPGVAHARRCGLENARFDIVSFVDDDNWVCENWIQAVSVIMENQPGCGACGCRAEAHFETSPPPWLGDLVRTLAIGTQSPESGDVTDTRGWFWGAGMSLRKSAWQELISHGYKNLLTSRTRQGLGAGEDAEFCLALRMAGWRLHNSNELSLVHFVPKHKLRWDYFRKMFRGFGASEVILDIYESNLDDPLGLKFQKAHSHRRVPKWLSALWRIPILWSKLALKSPRVREGDEDVLRLERLLGYIQCLWQDKNRLRSLNNEIAALAQRLQLTSSRVKNHAAVYEGRPEPGETRVTRDETRA